MATNDDNLDRNATNLTGRPGGATTGTWESDRAYWQDNFAVRPYASGDRGFDYYEPGYRYGYEAANKYRGRQWQDVEPELRNNWNSYEHRGKSTWDEMKGAVKDAWDRLVH